VRGAAFALALAALGSGCVTYERGVLAAASTRALDIPMTIVKKDAQGRSCRTVADPRYALAVEDALKGAPGANALVNATYRMEQALCIVVEGTAVRVP
jgi:hypothetical protein